MFNLVYTTGPLNSHGGLKLPQENNSRPNECSLESLRSLQRHWNSALFALCCLFNNFHLIYYFVWRLPMLTRSLILLVARFDNHIMIEIIIMPPTPLGSILLNMIWSIPGLRRILSTGVLSWPQGSSYPSTCSALTHLFDNKVTRASCYLHHSHGSEPRDQPPRGWSQPQGLLAGGTTCQGSRWSFHQQGIPPALSTWDNPPAWETFAQGLRPVWGPLRGPLEGSSTLLCCISLLSCWKSLWYD